MRFGRAGDLRGGDGYHDARGKRRTARTLAILTVTVEHGDRLLVTGVANGTASTAAGISLGHCGACN